jgi:hypothetical protein
MKDVLVVLSPTPESWLASPVRSGASFPRKTGAVEPSLARPIAGPAMRSTLRLQPDYYARQGADSRCRHNILAHGTEEL